MSEASKPHSELPEHARDWIEIPPTPERLAEIRTFADSDVLDLVEPDEMYYFLGLLEQYEVQRDKLVTLDAEHDRLREQFETLLEAARMLDACEENGHGDGPCLSCRTRLQGAIGVVATSANLDDIDPRDLGDGMEATVEPGDAMTEAELDNFNPARRAP